MKPLFVVGIVILVLGIASFFVALPHRETHGIKAGDVSISATTRHDERLPAWASGLLVVGGIALMLSGGRSR